MPISLWPVKNRVSEVGQHSGWGPEATCMHPQNNNTPSFHVPPPRVLSLMEGLALAKEHKGLDDLSAADGATKATTN